MSFKEDSIRDFLAKTASSSPTPGGGTAAAFAGSLASALSEMVCNLTIGKEKYRDVERVMKEEREKCMTYREQLLTLMDEDAHAFDIVMKAFRIPRENKGRQKAIQDAYRKAASVPLTTAELCLNVMRSAKKIVEKGNKSSITDAASSAVLANAAVHAALFNVKINLAGIKDEKFVTDTVRKIKVIEEAIEKNLKDTMYVVEDHI